MQITIFIERLSCKHSARKFQVYGNEVSGRGEQSETLKKRNFHFSLISKSFIFKSAIERESERNLKIIDMGLKQGMTLNFGQFLVSRI